MKGEIEHFLRKNELFMSCEIYRILQFFFIFKEIEIKNVYNSFNENEM